ncbi:Cna B-type domain-containing protein [Streptococcus macedonicus]|uniref:Collagen adhesin n=1 Tax=Streptococcus gallolyticus TaxID=315405 RepID=A0A380K2J0_9STRE|nr:Cna B-type domain-containing protein [Streptococcus macedonicus]WGK79104.1 Cna B-type domain-containing protein [Streptococcus macedonicus]SUN58765.1 Collagen adhesin [Streptococcus gallolyticus]
MKKLFSILVVLLSVLCFLGGEKGVLAESNSLETFRGYVNNDGKSSESRLGINNIYIDDNSQTIVGYCFNIKKQYSSMYGDRYTKCTNVTVEQMKENSSSTLEDAVLYDSVMKVLYNGYPNNGSSIQQKYQLTDDQFRGITQLVIWKFTDSYTGYSFSSDNLENVYNELRNVSQLIYPYVQNFLAAEMLPENQTEYTSVSVKKVWDDSDDQDGLRPNSIDVQLYANGKKSGDVVTLTAADNWTYTWTNLAEKANKKRYCLLCQRSD